MRSHPRHRHLIAAPALVAALMLLVLFDRSLPVIASSANASQESRIRATEVEQQFSTHGSLLLQANGSVSADAGNGIEARIFAGSMLLLRDDLSLTIIALSAPAVLSQAERLWVLPQGYQIRVNAAGEVQRSKVPDDWLVEQAARSRSLPLTPSIDHQSLSALLHDATMISVEQLSDTLGGKDASDPASFAAALRLAIAADRLDEGSSDLVTKRILSQPNCSDECVFAVPAIAATSLRPLPAALLTEWVKLTISAGVLDAARTVETLHSVLPELPARLENAGYPKQAMLWRDAIGTLDTALASQFSGPEKDQFTSDIAAALHQDLPESDSSSSSAASEAPLSVSKYEPRELKILARELLDTHGVLFTTATQIIIDETEQDCARITNVFVAEGGLDVPYAFSFCPADRTIRRIIRDAKRLPNSVPVERFFQ